MTGNKQRFPKLHDQSQNPGRKAAQDYYRKSPEGATLVKLGSRISLKP